MRYIYLFLHLKLPETTGYTPTTFLIVKLEKLDQNMFYLSAYST